MSSNLTTHILDYDIYDSDYNPKTLVFMDKSEYMEDVDRPKLEILLPGYSESKVIPININELNVINSSALRISPVGIYTDLPDGIYVLTYRICPYDIFYKKKIYLRTILLEHRLWEILTINTDFSSEDQKKLLLFDKLLKTAKSYAFKGNIVKSQLYYKEAENLLNTIKNNC